MGVNMPAAACRLFSARNVFLFLSQYIIPFNDVSSDMHIYALFAISHT